MEEILIDLFPALCVWGFISVALITIKGFAKIFNLKDLDDSLRF